MEKGKDQIGNIGQLLLPASMTLPVNFALFRRTSDNAVLEGLLLSIQRAAWLVFMNLGLRSS